MVMTFLKPRLLIGLAIAGYALGLIALFAGLVELGPIALFVGVFCTILAAIMITTPEAEVAAARKALLQSPTSNEAVLGDISQAAEADETIVPDAGLSTARGAGDVDNKDPDNSSSATQP